MKNSLNKRFDAFVCDSAVEHGVQARVEDRSVQVNNMCWRDQSNELDVDSVVDTSALIAMILGMLVFSYMITAARISFFSRRLQDLSADNEDYYYYYYQVRLF